MSTVVDKDADEVQELELVIEETNQLVILDEQKLQMIAILRPVANRLAKYDHYSRSLVVTTQAAADAAAEVLKEIAADIAIVTNVLTDQIDRLHKAHRRSTGFRGLFLDPLDHDRRTIKGAVAQWQEAEQRKADALQRKLQAEADEKARKEREREELEARKQREAEEKARQEAEQARQRALHAKSEAERLEAQRQAIAAEKAANAAAAKAELRDEKAAAVVAPVVQVAAPKATGVRIQKRWKLVKLDKRAFITAAAANPMLDGYIEIDEQALARTKAANTAFQCPGVTFEQVSV